MADKSNLFNKNTFHNDIILRSWLNQMKKGVPRNNPTFTTRYNKQGGSMARIKFTDWEKTNQKGYAMIEIRGTYADSGKPFKTRIFSSAKEMVSAVKEAKEGDILALTYKQNGQYKNVSRIQNEGKGTGNTGVATGPVPAGAAIVSAPPVDEKVVHAKMALDFYKAALAAKVKPTDIGERFVDAISMADMITDWKEGKGAFAMTQDDFEDDDGDIDEPLDD